MHYKTDIHIRVIALKGIVQPKMKVCWMCSPQPIQDVDELIFLNQIWRNLLAVDALQWMGAVRLRVQTADKNITIIHTTPVHPLTSGEDKSWNKYIKMLFFKSIITLPPVKKTSVLVWIRDKSSSVYKPKQL